MKQKVLFIKSVPAVPIQGADISMFERMALLDSEGWSGAAVTAAHTGQRAGLVKVLKRLGLEVDEDSPGMLRYSYQSVPCRIILDPDPAVVHTLTSKARSGIERVIGELSPDLILSNLRDFRLAGYYSALRRDARFDSDIVTSPEAGSARTPPAVFFLTENEFPRRGSPDAAAFAAHLTCARHIVVASEFLASSFEKEWGVRPQVFLNTINTARFRPTLKPGKLITLFHPYAHKGLDFVLQIADERPDLAFGIVAGAGAEYSARKSDILSRKNVALIEFTSDPEKIYHQSRVVLVPSLWEEAFSRVVIEACCCGVPVITSRSGGLPSTCGSGGLSLPVERDSSTGRFITADWHTALDQLLDPLAHSEASNRAVLRAEAYRRDLPSALGRISAFFNAAAGNQGHRQ